MKKRVYTDDEMNALSALHYAGASGEEIAQVMGLKKDQVAGLKWRNGLTSANGGKGKTCIVPTPAMTRPKQTKTIVHTAKNAERNSVERHQA